MTMNHMELAARSAAARHTPTAARWLGLLFGLLLLTLLARPAWADPADPPGRIGRLSELNGQVWIYAPESSEWIAAARNRPVTSGDRLSTEADGRAEVRIGSTVLRVDANTELEILQLDDDHVSLQLHTGSVSARLRTRESADEFSLETREGRFRTERTGSYRFDRIDDTSNVTVWNGQAVFEGDGTALTVPSGQRAEFWKDGRSSQPQYSLTDPKRDAFSDWVASRDQRDERSVSARYVSPEMTGVEDLDRYGRWEQAPDYGAIWIPRAVAADWAPYRMGHWAWVSPWGWTWVDDAPWGFAPFHYGRWVYFRNNWCWTPGTYVARPVYAPALVAWVGGPRVSVSVSVGSAPTVGWFPLGPREVFVPGYHVSPVYVRNVNVTHVTNITNVTTIINDPGRVVQETHYVNRGLSRAVTVVPSTVMERRQPVAPAAVVVNDRVLHDIARERPRFDAPVAAPVHTRFEPGTGRVDEPSRDPRNGGRFGGASNALAPVPLSPRMSRIGGGGAMAMPSPGAPAAVVVPRERRDRDNPVVQAAPVNAAPPGVNAVPVQPTMQQPNAPRVGERGRPGSPPDAERVMPSPAQREVIRGNPPAAAPVMTPVAPPAEREVPRMRNHEMPGPPRNEVQAPQQQQQPRQQPQVQAPVQAPPQIKPAPAQAAPQRPMPEARPPEVQRAAPREAPKEGPRENPKEKEAARENGGEPKPRGREDRRNESR